MCSVIIAQADADKHKSLDARFDITGFPTILFFEKGSTKPKEECVPPFQIVIPRHGFHRVFLHVSENRFSGERTAEGLLEFVNRLAGTTVKLRERSFQMLL